MKEIPGFYIDPNTRKYYRILPNLPGMAEGFTQAEVDKKVKITRYYESLSQQASFSTQPLPLILRRLELNCGRKASLSASNPKWKLENERLRRVKNRASHIVKVTSKQIFCILKMSDDHHFDTYVGCKYLYLDDDGTTLLGCWGVKHSSSLTDNYPSCARVVSYNVKINTELAA